MITKEQADAFRRWHDFGIPDDEEFSLDAAVDVLRSKGLVK
jgi:hypothetical protein